MGKFIHTDEEMVKLAKYFTSKIYKIFGGDTDSIYSDCLYSIFSSLKNKKPEAPINNNILWRDCLSRSAKNIVKMREEKQEYDNVMDANNSCPEDTSLENKEMVAHLMAQLTNREREIVYMKQSGLTYDQIGRKFNFSRQWSEMQYKDALKKMRDIYERECR